MGNHTILNPDTFRTNVQKHIYSIFEKNTKSQNIPLLTYLSKNIEIGVFNFTIKESVIKKTIKKWENPIFVHIYMDKLRSVNINIKETIIINNLIMMKIRPHDIAFMTHQELNPEKWEKLIELKYKRDESKFNVVVQPSTDVYVCRKCKSRKCTYSAQQTRSSDEPMTIYVSCLNCGKNWAC
jgi:DNA-directed RNA polymerase subunit M/transcription elongation factor TFIIS